MKRLEIYEGQRFNKLTVISEIEPKLKGNRYKRRINCKCDCGNIGVFVFALLTSGNTKSCGCLRSETIIIKNKASVGIKKTKYKKMDEIIGNTGFLKGRREKICFLRQDTLSA